MDELRKKWEETLALVKRLRDVSGRIRADQESELAGIEADILRLKEPT